MRAPFQHPTRPRRALRRYHLLPVLAALVALFGGSLLMVVNAPRALACPVCVSPDKVTLTGDGISGVMTIIDPTRLTLFGAATFMGFEQSAPVAEPAHTGKGYELTRYFKNSGVPASFWTLGFDHMRYYPGASGQPGYVYYEGFVSDEASRYAQNLGMPQSGRWYQLTASEDEAIQQVLVAHSNPATSISVSSPPTSTQPPAILRALSSLS
ncbi:MAG TPA: hypothetical protein VFW76_05420, partial [Ktedonobacterales bacterium]|nr:hypothetical protein [Ktedonobacterales bacterium]